MILAFDVAYNENNIAQVAAIGFEKFSDQQPKTIYREFVIGLEPYQPGEFYKRELPCIRKVLEKIDLTTIDTVVIDGYVYTDDNHKPGLGAHLYNSLGGKIPVIGVAKTAYAGVKSVVQEILRGNSSKPLYISSIGVELGQAAESIKNMDGEYRIPTLLKKLDQLSKR